MRASFRSLTVVALLAVGAAVPAYAQSVPSDAPLSTYPTCTASKPSQAETDAAHGAYMAGKGSYDESDYTTAINYFKDAYRRDCTKNELLVIIARSYELQGNRREAVHALETYLERAPAAPDADVQKRHIANLKRELADQPAPKLVPSAPPSVAPAPPPPASVSAAVVPPAPPPPAAASPSEPAPANGSSHSAAPWIVVGVGGAALITGAILYGVGAGKVSTSETNCPPPDHTGPKCTSSDASTGNSGRTLESVGVIAGAAGIAAVGAGIVWHFLEPASSSSPQTARASVVPQVAPGYAGLGVVGRF